MIRTLAIVGAKFRPPALGLLSVLPAGASLVLCREPSNPYDPNAIMVLVPCETLTQVPSDKLDAAVAGYGCSYGALMAQESWHLGYVPRAEAAELALIMDRLESEEYGAHSSGHSGPCELPGELAFGPTGTPSVRADFG